MSWRPGPGKRIEFFGVGSHVRPYPLPALKSFALASSASHRRLLRPLRADLLPAALARYPSTSRLDLSSCARVPDAALTAVPSGSSLRALDLSRSGSLPGPRRPRPLQWGLSRGCRGSRGGADLGPSPPSTAPSLPRPASPPDLGRGSEWERQQASARLWQWRGGGARARPPAHVQGAVCRGCRRPDATGSSGSGPVHPIPSPLPFPSLLSPPGPDGSKEGRSARPGATAGRVIAGVRSPPGPESLVAEGHPQPAAHSHRPRQCTVICFSICSFVLPPTLRFWI